jgi:hypothetical protein
MQKITNIEEKADKNGNPQKVTTFDNGDKVWVSSKYDEAIYDKVEVGAEFELYKDGTFNKIKYDKPAPKGGAGVAKMMEKKEASIEKFQDKKEESIQKASIIRDSTMLASAFAQGRGLTETEIKASWENFNKFLTDKWNSPF